LQQSSVIIAETREEINDRLYALVEEVGQGIFQALVVKKGLLPDLKPLFLNLKKKFTMYSAREIMTLPSSYSQKMFMLLKSWSGLPEITIEIQQLHTLLDTPASLEKNFKDFRRRVLEQAHKDIMKTTALFYQWEPVKKQRAVTAIHFIFSETIALEKAQVKQKNLEEELKELRAASIRCYYKYLHQEKECRPNLRNKKCKYCLEQGKKSHQTQQKQKSLGFDD
jgi:plasmid replication initiation protein